VTSRAAPAVAIGLLAIAACRDLIGYEAGLSLDADAGPLPSRGSGADSSPEHGTDAAPDAADPYVSDGSAPSCAPPDPNPSVEPRSCTKLAPTCGPDGGDDCCAWTVLPAGAYDRTGKGGYDASVSAFGLDTYEVTVGRFRAFVAEYAPDMTPACAGRNAHDPNDPGWYARWKAELPEDRNALVDGLMCGTDPTWTADAGDNENRPINCLTWYEAQAFCIWDHGRLPTEAEWIYAAVGGSQARKYPWGSTVPNLDTKLATYGCLYPTGASKCVDDAVNISPVGRSSAGNARWGQADMAGNLLEWVLDFDGDRESDCHDCAILNTGLSRVIKGSSYFGDATELTNDTRQTSGPTVSEEDYGVRCARNQAP
jgi:formylglycine-generating enzyme required for sulfatase activity